MASRDRMINVGVAVAVAFLLLVFYLVFYSHEEPKSEVLERYIADSYAAKGRDVRDVACRPFVRFVNGGTTYHLTCTVDLPDGETERVKGTIISPHLTQNGGKGRTRYLWTVP